LRLGFDIGTEVRTEAPVDDDVDPPLQQTLQFLDQGEVVAESAILRHVDQKIDVAVGSLLATPHRTEEPQIGRSVASGYGQQQIAVAVQVIA